MNAIAIVLVAFSLAGAAHADEKHHPKPAAAAQGGELFEGEVRRVDKDARKITIKHGPLQRLDMPPMTMVFQASDPALLERVKPGDKIRFDAEKAGGAFRVTRIEPAR